MGVRSSFDGMTTIRALLGAAMVALMGTFVAGCGTEAGNPDDEPTTQIPGKDKAKAGNENSPTSGSTAGMPESTTARDETMPNNHAADFPSPTAGAAAPQSANVCPHTYIIQALTPSGNTGLLEVRWDDARLDGGQVGMTGPQGESRSGLTMAIAAAGSYSITFSKPGLLTCTLPLTVIEADRLRHHVVTIRTSSL